jgi:hypothetical protein
LSYIVETICRDFRLHDETELKKLVEWQKCIPPFFYYIDV